MKTVIATGNENKVREIGQILGAFSENVISMKEAGIDCEIIEDGNTFLSNALIKARTVKKYWEGMVVADDSGLVIDALGGDPGVMSSRYLGEDTPYDIKNKELLKRLEGVEEKRRTARFVCAMAAVMPDGQEICVEETVEGIIGYEIQGENGFGYDPIFFIPEKGKTLAELMPKEKNAISHRGKALRKLREKLSPVKMMAYEMKNAAPLMAACGHEERVKALNNIKNELNANKESIFEANRQDIKEAENEGISDAVIKRLKFDEDKLASVISGIDSLIGLPDPMGNTTLKRELSDGLIMSKKTVPIGLIGVIFEARPDAMVQIATLCIKSGNMCFLKGGKETENTNKAIFDTIKKAIKDTSLPYNCLERVSKHSEIDELLTCDGAVDLLIPRGSNAFVKYVMDNTSIPVLGHADGICHTYVDSDCDISLATKVCLDAKIQYPAACNATETILVARDAAKEFLPAMFGLFKEKNVRVLGTKAVSEYIPCELISDYDFKNEYLDLVVAIKLVDDVKDACDHINSYGSHHTDAIITENDENWRYFENMVDSAGVYRNISTRFADGFRYGFGAEVGISTSKIHARGPVGLEGLMTYKYVLEGEGHTVGEFESGKKSYTFKDFD